MRFHTWIRVLVAGAVVLASASAFGINRRDDVPDAKYLALAEQAQFSMVGQLVAGLTGTATFIGFGNDKAWILTAKHVLDGYVANKATFTVGGKTWKVDTGGIFSKTADLAVVPLVNFTKGDLTPAAFMNSPLAVPENPNKRSMGYLVGYGKSGTGSNPGTVDDDQKRACTNIIDGYNINAGPKGSPSRLFPGYVWDFDKGDSANNTLDDVDNTKTKFVGNQTSSRSQTSFEGSGDEGDSGGPLFVQSGESWLVAGVFFATADPSGTGAWKPNGYGGWDEFVAMNADNATWITENTGIAAVPEPTSLANFALGAGLLVLFRRRRSLSLRLFDLS